MRKIFDKYPLNKIIFSLVGMTAIVLFALFAETGDQDRAAVAGEQTDALAGRLIVVDAGHGGNDPGALGAGKSVKESKLNLQVAEKLKAELEGMGAQVIMTRTEDKALGRSKSDDMYARQKILGRGDIDIGISIHMNYISDGSVRGPMVFYYPKSAEGEKLAKIVQKALDQSHGIKSRTPHSANFYVLRVGKCPAIMVECGFLSNYRDIKLLQSAPHQLMLAQTIAGAVSAYFEGKPLKTPEPSGELEPFAPEPFDGKCCESCTGPGCDGCCEMCEQVCGGDCQCE